MFTNNLLKVSATAISALFMLNAQASNGFKSFCYNENHYETLISVPHAYCDRNDRTLELAQLPIKIPGTTKHLLVPHEIKSDLSSEYSGYIRATKRGVFKINIDGNLKGSDIIVHYKGKNYHYFNLTGLKKTDYNIDLFYHDPRVKTEKDVISHVYISDSELDMLSDGNASIAYLFDEKVFGGTVKSPKAIHHPKINAFNFTQTGIRPNAQAQGAYVALANNVVFSDEAFDQSKLDKLKAVKTISAQPGNPSVTFFGFVARKAGLYSMCIDSSNSEKAGFIAKHSGNHACTTVIAYKPGIYKKGIVYYEKNPGNIAIYPSFYRANFHSPTQDYKLELVMNEADYQANLTTSGNGGVTYSPSDSY